MTFQPLDIAAFVGFLLLVVGVSLYASRGKHDAGRLLPGGSQPALVADRLLADRVQHLDGALRGDGGPGLRPGAGHRELRVDGGGHPRSGRPLLPAQVPASGHLHHPRIPRIPLRCAHPDPHGGLHHGGVRLRRAGHGALFGGARPRVHLRDRHDPGHLDDRRARRRLHDLRGAQGGRLVRPDPGGGAAARGRGGDGSGLPRHWRH